MKKILVTILAAALVVSMVACGNKSDNTTETAATETVATETATPETETTETVSTETVSTETEASANLGDEVLAAFKEFADANPEATAQEAADSLSATLENYFTPMVAAVEPGLLNGFDNTEITGFEEGVVFSPMIGTIPFVGYVFTLAEDADMDAFVATLTESANMRWNVCTEADQMITETVGNKVFFLMCPNSFE